MTSSKFIRWGATAAVVAALLVGAVALVQFLLGPIGGYRCDEKRLASRAFAGEVEGASPPVWDAYLLYGPEATWGNAVPRPMSSGYTVYGAREELKKNIRSLLE